jgi:hypothetical protein
MLWKEDSKTWTIDPALGIHVNVEVCLLYCQLYESKLMIRKCRLDIRSSIRGDHRMEGLLSPHMKLVRTIIASLELANG